MDRTSREQSSRNMSRMKAFQRSTLVYVIRFLQFAGMQVGLRHFDSRTLVWLTGAWRSGGAHAARPGPRAVRAHRLAQRPRSPVSVGGDTAAAGARGAHRDRAFARPRRAGPDRRSRRPSRSCSGHQAGLRAGRSRPISLDLVGDADDRLLWEAMIEAHQPLGWA